LNECHVVTLDCCLTATKKIHYSVKLLIPQLFFGDLMKNSKTPRNLADCEFPIGYAPPPKQINKAQELFEVILTIIIFAGIGALLAWRG